MALPMSLKRKGIIYPDYNTMRAVLNGKTELAENFIQVKKESPLDNLFPTQGNSDQVIPKIIPYRDLNRNGFNQALNASPGMDQIGDRIEDTMVELEVIIEETEEEVEESWEDIKDEDTLGYQQYKNDLDQAKSRDLPSREDYSTTISESSCNWTYFSQIGHLKPYQCPSISVTENCYNDFTVEENCIPGQAPQDRARKFVFDDCPYTTRDVTRYPAATPQWMQQRANFFGVYKTINLPNRADNHLSIWMIEMRIQVRSIWEQNGPPLFFGVTAKQKDCTPDNLRFFNLFTDLPADLEGSAYFTPHSKEKTGAIWRWDGPNTICTRTSPQNISSQCNWFSASFLRRDIICRYFKELTFFVAFSDYIIDHCLKVDTYEGWLGDINIEVTEAQAVRNSAYKVEEVGYVPMKFLLH